MTIKCSNCGQQMVVEGSLKEGECVQCPHCGEITAYSKPKLTIRRPSQPPPQGGAGNALVDRVQNRARLESRRAFWAHVRKCCKNALSILLLLGMAGGGWWLFRHWKDLGVATEIAHRLDGDKGSTSRESDSSSGASAAEETASLVKRQKESTGAKKSLPSEDGFTRVVDRFLESHVLSWRDLASDSRPGKADALFSLWCPVGNSEGRFFEITSSPTGIVSIVQYQADGAVRELGTADYEKMMLERGGFVCKDNEAYFVTSSKSSKNYTPPLRSGESFDPSAEYFKSAQQFISKHRMKTADVAFEVRFLYPEQEAISIAQTKYGEKVSYARFREAVAPLVRQLRQKTLGAKPVLKPYKATVVFYDGATILKDARGRMKIPRNGALLGGQAYKQWRQLRDEAYLQESKAQEFEWKQRRAIDEWQRKCDAPPTHEETARVLAVGHLNIVRK